MGSVVVVGGGFGGMAAAARLAKLGHEVTVVEASSRLGGALGTVEQDGFTWEAGPTTTLMPAVVRDLFRKSGRPLEDELTRIGAELVPVGVLREHRFEDGTTLRLPGGSRSAQVSRFEELETGLGEAWARWVDAYAATWDLLRRHHVEVAVPRAELPREVTALLDQRDVLSRTLRRGFRDDRPASVAGHPFVLAGHDLRDVPHWAGLEAYLEQCFGAWTVTGGMHRLGEVLAARLALRGVEVLLDTPAHDLVVRDGRVRGVATAGGEIAADAVVVAVDPRRLPGLAAYVKRSTPAIPPVVTHLGLQGELPGIAVDPDQPTDVVVHGDPVITIRPGGRGPEGTTAITLLGRGRLSEDMLAVLAREGIRLRDQVVSRVDLSPRQLVEQWHGSPLGVRWSGRSTVRQRLGPTTPVPGVYAAGAHAAPGSGLAFVGLSAALVAAEIGPA